MVGLQTYMCFNMSVNFILCVFLSVSVCFCVHYPHCQITGANTDITLLLIPVSVPALKNPELYSTLKLSTHKQTYAHTHTHIYSTYHTIVG